LGRIFSVRLFQKKNGFWYVQVDRDHKRSLNTRDPEEAVLAFNAFQTELLKGKIRALDEGKRISLKTFRDNYAKSRKEYSPDTLRADEQAFKNLVAGFGESATLLSITPERIAEWRENLLRRVSLGSVKTWSGHLRAAFAVAIEWGYIRKNPFVGKRRGPYGTMHETGKKEIAPPRYVSPEDFEKILEHEPREDWRRAFRVYFTTGMRRRELVRMKWSQVGGDTLVIIGKGGKTRYFPLSEEIRALLGDPGKPGGYIFPLWRDANTITRRFRTAAIAARMPDVSPHTLRHAFATRLAMAGLGKDVRMPLMGHSTEAMSDLYTNVTQEYLRSALCAPSAPPATQVVEK
jgi:integrase